MVTGTPGTRLGAFRDVSGAGSRTAPASARVRPARWTDARVSEPAFWRSAAAMRSVRHPASVRAICPRILEFGGTPLELESGDVVVAFVRELPQSPAQDGPGVERNPPTIGQVHVGKRTSGLGAQGAL